MHLCSQLLGKAIHATDGDLGSVRDIYFDDHEWRVRFLVVKTGGWLTGRRVLISPEAVTGVDWEAGRVNVKLTREQVRTSPDVDTERPISVQAAMELSRHYGWLENWVLPVPGFGAAPGTNVALGDEEDRERSAIAGHLGGDPHLRSFLELRGYEVEAGGDRLGEVEDFQLLPDMRIPEVIVDRGHVLPGEKVHVPSSDIRKIEWSHSRVVLSHPVG